MSGSPNIAYDRIPAQSDWRGKRARVIFHYDHTSVLEGTIVRNDIEAPFTTIIMLDDGFPVLGVECQYQPIIRGR